MHGRLTKFVTIVVKKDIGSLSVMHSGQEVDQVVPRTVRNRKGPVWLPLR